MGLELTGLENKVAVVTGAGRMRSIGRAIAVELAKGGCHVVVTGTGRSPDKYPDDEKQAQWQDIDSVAQEIESHGVQALALVSDVTSPDSVRQLCQATIEQFGRVDFVINNAGAPRGGDREPVVDLEPSIWRRVLDVNLTGAFYMCREFGQQLIKQDQGGGIVNISSIGGKLMAPNTAAYAASKAGLHALTAAMSGEVGQHQIRVNAICPGIVKTSRLDDLPAAQWDEIIQQYIPLGRAGSPHEVAALTAFLCSDLGAWISGQFYSIDGGQLAGR